MPIVGIASYIPTLNQFVSHWANANVELSAVTLTLPQAISLPIFRPNAPPLSIIGL